jgi:tripartite-type tricarboxylate transporter receptor subunit TctC
MNQRRSFLHIGLVSIFSSLGIPPVFSKTLDTAKIINGFAAGGTADIVSRLVAEKINASYSKNVIVENRTGAGGQIAVQAVKNAPADGSQILLTPMSMLGIYPHTYQKLPYEASDLTPVSGGALFDYGFAVGPLVPSTVTNVPEFLNWCKANPSLANFGSPALGSSPHFIGTLLGRSAGVNLQHIAFRGTQPAILDMIGGQIAAVSGPTGDFTQHVKAGRCRLLSTSGPKRNRFTPQVPTLIEQGFKDMAITEWFGFFLPNKASVETINSLNLVIREALGNPEVIDGLAQSYLEAYPTSPSELATRLKLDSERWSRVVKTLGFSIEA